MLTLTTILFAALIVLTAAVIDYRFVIRPRRARRRRAAAERERERQLLRRRARRQMDAIKHA